MNGWAVTGIICLIIGIILAIVLPACSVKTVETTQVGLDYDTTTMEMDETTLYQNGRYFIGVSHYFITYNTQLNTIKVENIDCRSIDGLLIKLSISYQYRLKTTLDDILNIFFQFPYDGHEEAYIRKSKNVIRDVTSKFTAYQFVSNRTDIEIMLRIKLNEGLNQFGSSIEQFQLLDIDFPDSFQNSITEAQNAIFDIQTAEFSQSKSQTEAEGLINRTKTEYNVTINNAEIQATNLMQIAQSKVNALNQRLQSQAQSLGSLASNLNLDSEQLVSYIWSKGINDIANNGNKKLQVNFPMPTMLQCLFQPTNTC